MFASVSKRLSDWEVSAYSRLRALANARSATRARERGREPRPAHLLTGERGEDLAYFYLQGRGYPIVARRWRSPRLKGDLDLVGWDGPTLVIFEVKTRTARDLAPAETSIDAAKRRTLSQMALAYRRVLPEPWRDLVQIRFDVVSVYDLPAQPEFEHTRNAFPLGLQVH